MYVHHVLLLPLGRLRGVLLAHCRAIVLIPDSRDILQRRHHLCIGVVERLQLRVIVLLARLFETIGHSLMLLLCQLGGVLVLDHRVGSLVELSALCLSLVVDRFFAGKRGQLQVILQLVSMLDRAHAQFYLVLAGLLLTRHEKVIERVPNVLRLSMITDCAVYGPVRGTGLLQALVEFGAKFTSTQADVNWNGTSWLLLLDCTSAYSSCLLQDQRFQSSLDCCGRHMLILRALSWQ